MLLTKQGSKQPQLLMLEKKNDTKFLSVSAKPILFQDQTFFGKKNEDQLGRALNLVKIY